MEESRTARPEIPVVAGTVAVRPGEWFTYNPANDWLRFRDGEFEKVADLLKEASLKQ